jgi:hypothetical protein
MLERELEKLQTELPNSVIAVIQPADHKFAIDTLKRRRTPENPTKAAWSTAAGIAWERILLTRVSHVCQEHPELQVIAECWNPPGERIDLDMIIHDTHKHLIWILDAKNAKPDPGQLGKMRKQIRHLRQTPELNRGCPTIIGVIVHRKKQLDSSPEPTEHHDILRCTLQRLPSDLLLARRLPGEQRRAKAYQAAG